VQEGLNALAILLVHKEYIDDILDFIQKVTDKFMSYKNREG
jgi:hypothetical protein